MSSSSPTYDSYNINIAGLDKIKLLRALWDVNPPAISFKLNDLTPPLFDEDQAKTDVKSHIDYFQGRLIKMDLSGDTIYSRLYDRDSFISAKEIVDRLRSEK